MSFYTYTPQPPLSAFVDLLWLDEGTPQVSAKERLLPDGTFELVINLDEDRVRIYNKDDHDQIRRLPGSLICGAHSQYFVIDAASQSAMMGAHFKAGGAFPFLKLPAGELHNLQVSLEDLWGAAAGELRERLLETPTAKVRFHILEQALLTQFARSLTFHPAVAFALQEFHGAFHLRSVASVAEQIGLSTRRFTQVFQEQVGLTPKLFYRVQRFREVLRRTRFTRQVDWAAVAADCGYFDQAHFIHDFQAFSGLTPSAYLAQHTALLNHVPLSD